MRNGKLHIGLNTEARRHRDVSALLFVFVSLCSCLFLLSCTEVDVELPPGEAGTDARVVITPQAGDVQLPAGTQYYFYPASDGGSLHCLPCTASGGFDGVLPAGRYKVLAVNTNARGVRFEGMNAYETAAVLVQPYTAARGTAKNTRSDYNLLGMPDNVYVATISEIAVTPGRVNEYVAEPALLTQTVGLTITVSGLAVTVVQGALPGVYTGVRLCDGAPVGAHPATGTIAATPFEAGRSGDIWTADVPVLGLYDPHYGSSYSNKLQIEVAINSGATASAEVDVSNVLSDAIATQGGKLEAGCHYDILVGINNPASIELVATIAGWGFLNPDGVGVD